MKLVLVVNCFFLLVFSVRVFSQDNPLLLDRYSYSQLEKLMVKYKSDNPLFPADSKFSRKEVARFISGLPKDRIEDQDMNEIEYWVNENPEWFGDSSFRKSNLLFEGELSLQEKKPILKYLYKYPSNLLFVEKKDFFLSVNPILHWKLGRQERGRKYIFENRKGLELRTGIDDKVYIYTSIEDLQFSRPEYIDRYIKNYKSAPGYTFYSGYKADLLGGISGQDVLNSQAYLSVPVGEYISAQFGYGRQFYGSGMQSLLLSDFGGNYLHLNLEFQIWKMKYQYMIAEVTQLSNSQDPGDRVLPKKYIATHFLQFQLGKNAHLGLFESVVFNRQDHLELHYLLPVILFRTVERTVGSPDNVSLGLDFSWALWNKYKLYSQVIFDEFRISEFFGGNQWWANKYGVQLGLKAYDIFGIRDMDFSAEYNTVRPYTYSHRDTMATYTHYNSPLAHPSGANFREYIATLNYTPFEKWSVSGVIYHIRQGLDENGINYGADIRNSYSDNRPGDYGIETLQGKLTKIYGLQGRISYTLWHNAFLDLNLGLRKQDGNDNFWGSVSFRLNAKTTGNSIF
ncbi:hypothetical protein [Membranihabitans maritimus]|uniref:hypothetical protein n=1 Tax=Membranihabitans maritimus TaxID=2904244 RepID=UPI001F251D90|nr:hypothetical protein [Membranihabitans maritimus]